MDSPLELLEPEVASDSTTKRVRLRTDAESKKKLAKRIHDLNGAVSSMRMAVDSFKKGYRLDDSAAQKKIDYLDASVKVIEQEAELLKTLFRT